MEEIKKIKINNLPERVNEYVVYREVDDENWYWCSFSDLPRASEAALRVNGKICNLYEVE